MIWFRKRVQRFLTNQRERYSIMIKNKHILIMLNRDTSKLALKSLPDTQHLYFLFMIYLSFPFFIAAICIVFSFPFFDFVLFFFILIVLVSSLSSCVGVVLVDMHLV